MPEFSAKIDLGHIIQIVVLLTAFAVGWGIFQAQLGANHDALMRVEERLSTMDQRITAFRERQIEIGSDLKNHISLDAKDRKK